MILHLRDDNAELHLDVEDVECSEPRRSKFEDKFFVVEWSTTKNLFAFRHLRG